MPTCSENSFALFKMLAKHSRKCSLTLENCFENISECYVEKPKKFPIKFFKHSKFFVKRISIFSRTIHSVPNKMPKCSEKSNI